jgi:phage/plasmid-like protein (TIGR03299 family)
MADMIDMSNGQANIAFVGKVPWHGLGQELKEGAPLDAWKIASGTDFTYIPVDVQYRHPVTGLTVPFENRRVLARSDTGVGMSIVSGNKYKIVQPGEILEFYRDLINAGGFHMHTAGCLKEGKVVWALARIGDDARIMGQDQIKGFLLLASSCDGLMATRGMFTSVRVVCNNTLQMAKNGSGGVRVPHNRIFDAQQVRTDLGVGHQMFTDFAVKAETFAKRRVADKEAVEYIARVMSGIDELPEDLNELKNAKNIATVVELFKGKAMGAQLKSSQGTLWGAVNAVTEYCDHQAGRSADSRLSSSWFGQNRLMKDRAVALAEQLVAA